MIENIIEHIKESEEKSREIILQAKKEHTAIIEKGYAEAQQMISNAQIDAVKIMQEAEAKALLDSQSEISRMQAEHEDMLRNIKAVAASKEKEAVDKIIRRIFD